MEHGIHIFCEKPLAVTADQGRELIDLAIEKDIDNGVNFNYRNNVMVREMRARMNKDAGRCLLIYGTYVQDWLLYETDYNWRLNSKMSGTSRAVADIGSHCFDLVQNVCGKKVVSVNANLLTAFPTRKKLLTTDQSENKKYEIVPIDTEDAACIMIKLEDGIMGNVVISQVSAGNKNKLFLSADCERYSMRWDQQEADKLISDSRGFEKNRMR